MPNPYRLSDQWEHAIDGWLAWLRASGARRSTLSVRRGQVRAVARRTHLPPAELTSDVLIRLCGDRDWSNEYRRGVRAALVSFCDWCVTNRVLDTNPAHALPRVPEDKPRPRPAPDTVWDTLLATAPPRERLMAQLAGEAGLRRAEIAAVHTDDLLCGVDGWSLIVRGKGHRQRVLPIGDRLAGQIREHDGWVFPNRAGGHLNPRTVGKLLSNLMPAGWSCHKLRHRFSTRGYAGTRDLAALQLALGHSSPATTLRYTAISAPQVRAVTRAASVA